MGNKFDFELTAKDEATEAVNRINEAIKRLNPQLDLTRDGLKLGGQDSMDGLNKVNDQLDKMGKFARDGVQFVGDLIPPLKMAGEMYSKFGGMAAKIGGVAAGGYIAAKAIGAIAGGLGEAAENAYQLDAATKNSGMRVDDFTRLAGAMRVLGIDTESARKSVEGMYKTFNDALQGRNNEVAALFTTMKVKIEVDKDGTADVYKTFQNLAKEFPKLAPQMQKTVADSLGFDPSLLSLMREGARLKELLSKADKFGLTVDPATNKQLTDLEVQLNETSAAWEGLKQKFSTKLYTAILSDGSVKDGIRGVTDLITNGPDNIAISHALGFNRGDDADKLRQGYDPEVDKLLTTWEKIGRDFGIMTDGYRQKYDEHHGHIDALNNAVNQFQDGITTAATPNAVATTPSNNARGIRNNNPGNLRVAPNAAGSDGSFVQFSNPTDGMAALSRQLMLYGDRGNNTLNGVIHTYAPQSENNTQAYINSVSGATGINPSERINLHDPEILRRLMAAIIQHENGAQPYTQADIDAGINASINDDKWKGLRNPNILASQRSRRPSPLMPEQVAQSQSVNQPPAPNINASAKSYDSAGIASAIESAMRDSKMQVEVTLIDSKTGEHKTITGNSGGKVVTSMQYNG